MGASSNELYQKILENVLLNLSKSEISDRIAIPTRLKISFLDGHISYRPVINLYTFCDKHGKFIMADEDGRQKFLDNILKTKADIIYNNIREDNEKYIYELRYFLEGKKIPITYEIKKVDLKYDRIKSFILLLPLRQKKIRLYEFISEILLVRDFNYFMANLELSNEMSLFDEIYCLLTRESISGRIVISLIKENESKGIDENAYELIKGYSNNPYLKRKWNAYMKRQGISEPAWNEFMQTFIAFFSEIAASINSEDVFMLDWMPELKRFM